MISYIKAEKSDKILKENNINKKKIVLFFN